MIFENQVDDWTYPIMYGLIRLSVFAAAFFAFLFWLYQPHVFENPGLAAFQSFPGTRLVPLPRKMDAPEIIETASAETGMGGSAEADGSNATVKKSVSRGHKPKPRQKAVPVYRHPERAFAKDTFREWNVKPYHSWF